MVLRLLFCVILAGCRVVPVAAFAFHGHAAATTHPAARQVPTLTLMAARKPPIAKKSTSKVDPAAARRAVAATKAAEAKKVADRAAAKRASEVKKAAAMRAANERKAAATRAASERKKAVAAKAASRRTGDTTPSNEGFPLVPLGGVTVAAAAVLNALASAPPPPPSLGAILIGYSLPVLGAVAAGAVLLPSSDEPTAATTATEDPDVAAALAAEADERLLVEPPPATPAKASIPASKVKQVLEARLKDIPVGSPVAAASPPAPAPAPAPAASPAAATPSAPDTYDAYRSRLAASWRQQVYPSTPAAYEAAASGTEMPSKDKFKAWTAPAPAPPAPAPAPAQTTSPVVPASQTSVVAPNSSNKGGSTRSAAVALLGLVAGSAAAYTLGPSALACAQATPAYLALKPYLASAAMKYGLLIASVSDSVSHAISRGLAALATVMSAAAAMPVKIMSVRVAWEPIVFLPSSVVAKGGLLCGQAAAGCKVAWVASTGKLGAIAAGLLA